MIKLKLIFSNWTQTAGLILLVGALAWIVKLIVIISTNGRIITTGAAAFCMTAGLVMLFVGSTGIGLHLTRRFNLFIRALAVTLSPGILFGSFILFGMITNPVFHGSSVWYAQEEAPIGLAALVYLVVGYFLYTSKSSPASSTIPVSQ